MSIGMIVFLAAWATALTALLLLVVEWVGVWRFSRRAFQIGPIVFRESRSIPLPASRAPFEAPFETENGSFAFVAPDACMFRTRGRRDMLRLRTPFPTRGFIRWHGAGSEVEARIPLSTSLFFVSWLVGWSAGTAMVALASRSAALPVLALLLGWTFSAALIALSMRAELRRVQTVVDELEEWLSDDVESELAEEQVRSGAASA